jgi:aminopeptidase
VSGLEAYASVLIHVGVGLRGGDRLLVRTPPSGVELAHHVADEAYRAGARNVDVLIDDDRLTAARVRHGSRDALAEVGHEARVLNQAAERADAFLRLSGDEGIPPLDDMDLTALREHERRFAEATAAFFGAQMSLRFPWTIAGVPGPRWARAVFPDMPGDQALDALWDAVLRTSRALEDDPITAWRQHIAELDTRCWHLDNQQFDRLLYRGPDTDLVVGLARTHRWAHPASARADRPFVANIPTEEVPTAPDRERADGTVRTTKPVRLGGELVDGLRLTFAKGRVVEAVAQRGQDAVDELLEVPGADRLGEVSLVPLSTRVAAEQLVWHHALFDENDASHIALGSGIPPCIENGLTLPPDQWEAAGLNRSPAHVDLVVGSPDLAILGVRTDGQEVPLLIDGEWAFSL